MSTTEQVVHAHRCRLETLRTTGALMLRTTGAPTKTLADASHFFFPYNWGPHAAYTWGPDLNADSRKSSFSSINMTEQVVDAHRCHSETVRTTGALMLRTTGALMLRTTGAPTKTLADASYFFGTYN